MTSIEFASNGGGGSTVAVYQWADQTSQYIMKFRTKFTASMSFGVYANTPNNSNSNAEWAASFNGGSIVAGTETIEGVNANEWVDIVVSADPSVQKYSIAAYKTDGTLIGSASDIDMANNDSVQKYFCFMGTYPFYLNSFKAYKPSISSISVNSAEDVVKVPETGEEAKTVDLSAALADEDGTKITGAVNWSLADEYANVELTSTGAQTAVLKVSPGASGEIEVVASKDGKQASTTDCPVGLYDTLLPEFPDELEEELPLSLDVAALELLPDVLFLLLVEEPELAAVLLPEVEEDFLPASAAAFLAASSAAFLFASSCAFFAASSAAAFLAASSAAFLAASSAAFFSSSSIFWISAFC